MRQVLLGSKLLGNGGDLAGSVPRFIGPPYYLINDTFTTDRAAGAVNGTDAEPGPGRRTVIDTDGVLSLSGGSAVAASGAIGTPRIAYPLVQLAPGHLLKVIFNHASTGQLLGMAFTSAVSGAPGTYRAGSSGVIQATLNGAVTIGSYTTGIHEYVLVARCPGYFFIVKDPATTRYRLLAHSFLFAAVGQYYPAISARGNTAIDCRSVVVPAERWAPTPLVSDGFGTWGTSDGLGHPEGVNGTIGAGGNGVVWVQTLGTWEVTNGRAKPTALSGGGADAVIDAGKTDVIISVALHRGTTGFLTIYIRYADANNHIRLSHDGTQVVLIKRVAGADTTILTSAQTYSAGAMLMCQCIASSFRIFYNTLAVSGVQTISDAALQTGTAFGIRTNDLGNEFDDFTIYAIGSDGEYAALDGF